ncbi:MAG TPA: hypothetical protein DCP28_28800, partial [Cytophagales bacterium]|nr:hypothetical protein [Cytophagales bacterium]
MLRKAFAAKIMEGVKIFMGQNFGGLLGPLSQNAPHRHFTTQITVSEKPFVIHTDREELKSQQAILASQVKHQIDLSPGQRSLVLNVNPLSKLGLWCQHQLAGKEVISSQADFMQQAWAVAQEAALVSDGAVVLERFIDGYLHKVEQQNGPLTSTLDARIVTCLHTLYEAEEPPAAIAMAE